MVRLLAAVPTASVRFSSAPRKLPTHSPVARIHEWASSRGLMGAIFPSLAHTRVYGGDIASLAHTRSCGGDSAIPSTPKSLRRQYCLHWHTHELLRQYCPHYHTHEFTKQRSLRSQGGMSFRKTTEPASLHSNGGTCVVARRLSRAPQLPGQGPAGAKRGANHGRNRSADGTQGLPQPCSSTAIDSPLKRWSLYLRPPPCTRLTNPKQGGLCTCALPVQD